MAEAVERAGVAPQWVRNPAMLMGVGVIAILMVMVIPLPPLIIDLLLSLSITMAIVILLMSMFVLKPLEFSVFPSVLLTVTLFRLSLNVASTRLILLHGSEGTGAAGQVIKAFGTFVVGGNYVVGLVVFTVLTLINFVVITKGATRIAEVAARFTLDAMPGKQMSIDADLNAGLISETDARRRRSEIEREADFYGAMDGASKFVRGDAIAGVVIIFINIVGGLIIGVLQQGMDITDAARNYTLLTIGDGLVTQVPALIISTAAGMLVTRSTSSSNLGQDITEQLFVQPKAIGTAAAILFFFALIPGMPKVSFLLIAAGAGLLAWRLVRAAPAVQESAEAEAAPPSAIETVDLLLPLDPLEIEVGYGLIGYVDVAQGGELLQRIKSLRRQLAVEMGFVIPAIHIRDNLQLKPNQYTVILKGVEIARGELLPGHWLALTSDKTPRVKGIETKEPAFGLPAVWIAEKEKESVQARGVVVVDPATVVTTHLTEIVKAHADELLGRQEVQSLIDNLAKTHPRVIEELIPKVVSAGTLHRVLQRLLRERISIRDLLTVLETLADYAPLTKNLDILTGYVRQALARTITKQYRDGEGGITVVMLSPEIEDKISQSVQHTEYESYLSVDPNWVQKVVRGVQKFLGTFASRGLQPIVLCSPGARIHFRKVLEKFVPNIIVLSHNEITHDVNIKSLGIVE
ncbi:MAG: flagellar biosynthesis protein FlhA [Deltaproteobacteria bacterium]|nr:flagellar biosynthesis protein FlhA [Deltaproteobacteria bacterium]HOF73170.1 flagellar biosynthesis protein FlhA [Syntrophales bacterium]HOR33145.1 flagellar biosynthesis protein FlhA [Syntrophales bacterium]HPX02807.1 flagellar biosynthesis protein FlhA [Syntrophales bacterium]